MPRAFGMEERLKEKLYSCRRTHCIHTKVGFPMAIEKDFSKDY
jgi:hypothetical protein